MRRTEKERLEKIKIKLINRRMRNLRAKYIFTWHKCENCKGEVCREKMWRAKKKHSYDVWWWSFSKVYVCFECAPNKDAAYDNLKWFLE
jgi:hypothetical protein